MSNFKRLFLANIHKYRGRMGTLRQLSEKLTEREAEALCRLLDNAHEDGRAAVRSKARRMGLFL